MDNIYFFKNQFSLSNMHHSFSKLDWILTLMIIKKELKCVKFIFITHLNAFGSNVLLALKIMNFEDVV